MRIVSAKRLSGIARIPGDKSISHRAALIGALAAGETRIENFAKSADCGSTLRCLEDLGVSIKRIGNSIRIDGISGGNFRSPVRELDCGNSGTTMRLLAGILAGMPVEATLVGDDSLSERPMGRLIEPLELIGAEIRSNNGNPPLNIIGTDSPNAIDFKLTVASAQVKSCVLLAGLRANGTTVVTEPRPTRDHTELMLAEFGADISIRVEQKGKRITLRGGSELKGRSVSVPGDISSAAFFIAAAGCREGSELQLPNIGFNATRRAAIDVLAEVGMDITVRNERLVNREPVADIEIRGGIDQRADRVIIQGDIIPNLIDEIPILAVVGTRLDGGLEVREAGELRVKESDRITAVVENLTRMGAKVEEFSDGLRVERSELVGATIDSFGDHRIAMAFAVAALFAKGETTILGSECVEISFPGFFEVLQSLIAS